MEYHDRQEAHGDETGVPALRWLVQAAGPGQAARHSSRLRRPMAAHLRSVAAMIDYRTRAARPVLAGTAMGEALRWSIGAELDDRGSPVDAGPRRVQTLLAEGSAVQATDERGSPVDAAAEPRQLGSLATPGVAATADRLHAAPPGGRR
jgi:hypothetical protein